MIVVDDLKLCYVQIPHTGSTTIGNELLEHYGGRNLLRKHSYLQELKSVFPEIYKNYYIVGGVRNPLDERVSMYYKLKSNHLGLYNGKPVDPKARPGGRRARKFHSLIKSGAGFEEYLNRLPPLKYASPIIINYQRYDQVLRFESLSDDFDRLLSALGAKKIRELPHGNRTSGRNESYLSDYETEKSIKKALFIYSDFMLENGYSIPQQWLNLGVDYNTSWLLYELSKSIKKLYWRLCK